MERTSNVLSVELCNVLSDANIPFDTLKKSTILVTGAGGTIGGAIVRVLDALNNVQALNINIIAHTRKIYGDIRSFVIDGPVDYVFHCAAVTKSSDMVNTPVEVMDVAVSGTQNILNITRSCKSFVYLSSMEVYGQIEGEVAEEKLGYIDLLNPRSSYPESKRFCEALCVAHYKQYGVPVKIARLAQTFGGGVPKTDMRVFAQFARSAIAGTDIILHTEGNSVGNYCCISDTVRGLFTLLLKGENGQAYNIANPDATMTIREMAEFVARDVCGGKIKVRIEIPEDIEKRGYAPRTGLRLNTDKIKVLGWLPKYGVEEMYKWLIMDWKTEK